MDEFTGTGRRLDFEMVLVEISLKSPLPDSNTVHCNGNVLSQEVKYLWKPAACGKCNTFNHSEENCPYLEPQQLLNDKGTFGRLFFGGNGNPFPFLDGKSCLGRGGPWKPSLSSFLSVCLPPFSASLSLSPFRSQSRCIAISLPPFCLSRSLSPRLSLSGSLSLSHFCSQPRFHLFFFEHSFPICDDLIFCSISWISMHNLLYFCNFN